METKFTKSKWVAVIDSAYKKGVINPKIMDAKSGEQICLVDFNGDGLCETADVKVEEAHCNAKLIAAAPELLEALIEATEQLNVFSDLEVSNKERVKQAVISAQSAIKKATE